MALESLSAISSTFVAGPSGKKSKGKENTASGAKQNPFETTQVKANPMALANFKKYIATGQLKPKICDQNLDFVNCESEYLYIPQGSEKCEDVGKSLNIPEDYGFCDNSSILTIPKRIKAEDLEKFVGYQKTGKKK